MFFTGLTNGSRLSVVVTLMIFSGISLVSNVFRMPHGAVEIVTDVACVDDEIMITKKILSATIAGLQANVLTPFDSEQKIKLTKRQESTKTSKQPRSFANRSIFSPTYRTR